MVEPRQTLASEAQASPGTVLIGIAAGYVVLFFAALYGGHAYQMRRIRRRLGQKQTQKPR